jgi:hypothetical protein
MGAIAFLLRPPSHATPAPTTAVRQPIDAPPEPSAVAPSADPVAPSVAPGASTTPRPPVDLTGLTIAEQAAAVGDDDLSDGVDLPPPPITPGVPDMLPTQPEADPTRVLEQREAGLHLLDTTLERLGHEADDLERDGDSVGASRLRVRAARMTELRVRRAQELETLRAGGLLPTADPRIPGHGALPPTGTPAPPAPPTEP